MKRTFRTIVTLCCFTLITAACGGDDDPANRLNVEVEENDIPAWIDEGSTLYGEYDRVIATYADLVAFRDEINNATTNEELKLKAIQTADITMPATEEAWTVGIGDDSEGTFGYRDFQGVYNGNGYTITGLRVENEDFGNSGLFGVVTDAILVKIHLRQVDVSGEAAGSLAGIAFDSTISRCTATGTVKGGMAGGLVGQSNKTHYTFNHSACEVSGRGFAGGLVGYSPSDYIVSCVATGNVKANSTYYPTAGGLIGYCYKGIIYFSYATGNIESINEKNYETAHSGGLIGEADSKAEVAYCYSTGIATATATTRYIGTFVGKCSDSGNIFTYCWARTGSAVGDNRGTDLSGISADGTKQPVDVVRNSPAGGSITGVRTLVADSFSGATGPEGAKIAERQFLGSDVWTNENEPKIIITPL